LDRIKIFSPTEWELFVQEWVDSLRDQYELVERCGGAGDMGRDVIATVKGGKSWDNYQCKHYPESLKPSDVWLELGKLAYYTKRGDFEYPRRYYFIAPRGAGTTLSNLLKKPETLRNELLKHWNDHCRKGITKTQVIELDAVMETHIKGLDFSIFEATPVLRILDAHAKTRWHAARFGGGLPARPAPLAPPAVPANNESVFIAELRRAYADHLKKVVNDVDMDLVGHDDLRDHFSDARIEFYSAEGLRTFSRDTLPPGEFERLQDIQRAGRNRAPCALRSHDGVPRGIRAPEARRIRLLARSFRRRAGGTNWIASADPSPWRRDPRSTRRAPRWARPIRKPRAHRARLPRGRHLLFRNG
jgi:hypothetical protein